MAPGARRKLAYSVALSHIREIEPTDVLPPITAYTTMRVCNLPLVPHFHPGDMAFAEAVAKLAKAHHAVYATEELEKTAKPDLLLRDCNVRLLTAEQVVESREVYFS